MNLYKAYLSTKYLVMIYGIQKKNTHNYTLEMKY